MNKNDPVRFEELVITDFKIFRGCHRFVFNQPSTVIAGDSGSGRTTLFEALINPGEALKRYANGNDTTAAEPSIILRTSGNESLLDKHRDLIFVPEGAVYAESLFQTMLSEEQLQKSENDAVDIFNFLTGNKYAGKPFNSRQFDQLPAGVRICRSYAYLFAARKALNASIPLVIERPFSSLDLRLSSNLRDYLRQQKCQRILFVGNVSHEKFFQVASPQYFLERKNV